jgi:hypothetical protein
MTAIDVVSAASRSNPAGAARLVHRERGDFMPGFVPADPAEFFDPARERTVLAHHEAGHVLPKAAANADAETLLAGELAGRIATGVRADQIILPVKDLAAVGRDTPLRNLDWKPEHQGHDTICVLIIAYHLGVSDWGGWMCERHAEAERILRDNWDKLERLAGRLLAVEPYASAEDRRTGRPSGHVEGDKLIRWCHDLGVPVRDPRFTSSSYAAA